MSSCAGSGCGGPDHAGTPGPLASSFRRADTPGTGAPHRRLNALHPAALPCRARAAMPPITDAIGRTVTLKAPAERIVLGFNYEEFTAVAGAAGWDRVAGFGRALWAGWRPAVFSRYRQVIPNLDKVGDVGTTDDGSFSLERVLSLRPDLVVLAEWSFSVLQPQVAQLEALGIPVLVIDYNAQIPARHAASTIALGIATGNAERAQALADMYLSRVADIQTRNIAAGHIAKAWGPLSPEYIIAANPDHIFIAGSSWVNSPNAVLTGFDADITTTRARLAPYGQRPGWAGIAAIRRGELHAIEHGLCRALFDYTAMLYLAKQMHPDRFSDVDPVAELRRFHAQYLPVTFEGTWMARLTPITA